MLAGAAWAGLHATWSFSAQLPPAWEGRDVIVSGRVVGLPEPQTRRTRFLLRIALAGAAMVAFLLLARHQVGAWSALAPGWRVIHLAWIVAGAALVYALALLATGMRPRHLREG